MMNRIHSAILSTNVNNTNIVNKLFKRTLAHRDPLRERMERKIIPAAVKSLNEFKSEYKNHIIERVTVDQIYSGMRDAKIIPCETSMVIPEKGVYYRGIIIDEVKAKLALQKDHEPLPEAVFWFLLTGEVPTSSEVDWLAKEWGRRAFLPKGITNLLDNFPENIHPMAQFSAAVSFLTASSRFTKAYNDGTIKKNEHWKLFYEDVMDLIAKAPIIAAKIYRNVYHDGNLADFRHCRDLSDRYCTMLNVNKSEEFREMMSLYMVLHCDHEGANVCTHSARLVGSALSDPFLSFSAGLNGLAGPYNGRASQDAVNWLAKLTNELGYQPSDEELAHFCSEHLRHGMIPGFGHTVLYVPDPRFLHLLRFSEKNIKSDMSDLIRRLSLIIPTLIQSTGESRYVWPKVDFISGTILSHYGLVESLYHTVPFGVARSMGAGANLIWDRIFNYPIERPKSLTTESIMKLAKKAAAQA